MLDDIKELPIAQATERKIGGDENSAYPGNINVGGGFFEGHYPGNRLKIFTALDSVKNLEDEINKFFEMSLGLVVTGIWALSYGIAVLYTCLMSAEEVEGIQKFSSEVRAKLDEVKRKKAELAAEEFKRQQDAEKEKSRLAEIGRRCEENHKKDK